MASVTQVSPFILDSKNYLKQPQAQPLNKKSVKLNVSNPNLLENFLDLMANNNKSVISFGYSQTKHGTDDKEFVPYIPMSETLVKPYGQDFDVTVFAPTLSDYAKSKIYNESSSRINANRQWPKIENINAWMVTAETEEFKSDGGLGKVAADLPNSFNKKFNTDKDNYMSVITPMYVNGKEYKLEYDSATDKYVYHYGKRGDKQIDVEYKGKINVPIYVGAPHNTRLKDIDVRIFTTQLKTDKPKPTPYIFLEIPQYGHDANNNDTNFNQFFNIKDRDEHATNNNTPYANTEFSDPVFRMAFFSKSVYELMKSIKEGDFKSFDSPNVVLLNDWHAGSLAAMMHYTANAEADTGAISKETGRYFDETPTIYIVHNCEHQGASDGNDILRTNVFATLFGAYGADIVPNAKSWDEAFKEDKNALMRYTNFNSAKTGLSLVDRVVPVSDNYAQELIHSNTKANGMMDLMKARFYGHGHTLAPITNGYSKSLVVPNLKNMEKLASATINDTKGKDLPELDFSNFKSSNSSGGNFGGFSDFFSAIFGDLMSKQSGYSKVYTNGFDMGSDPFRGAQYQRSYTNQRQASQKQTQNLDITQNIELNVNDIFLAGTKGITVNDFRKCPYCGGNPKTFCSHCAGSGIEKISKHLNVKIPKFCKEGQKIRLKGEGKEDGYGNKGDLYLVIKIKDPSYTVEGSDLSKEIEISAPSAALGAKKEVITPHGNFNITIPPKSSSGLTLRMKGLGLPKKEGGFGNLSIKVKIVMPKNMSDEEIKLYKKLSEFEK